MIETFAVVGSERLDHQASKSTALASPMMPKFARDAGDEAWRTSDLGH